MRKFDHPINEIEWWIDKMYDDMQTLSNLLSLSRDLGEVKSNKNWYLTNITVGQMKERLDMIRLEINHFKKYQKLPWWRRIFKDYP